MDDTMIRTLTLVGFGCVIASACLMLFIPNMSPRVRKGVIGVLVFAVLGMLGVLLYQAD